MFLISGKPELGGGILIVEDNGVPSFDMGGESELIESQFSMHVASGIGTDIEVGSNL